MVVAGTAGAGLAMPLLPLAARHNLLLAADAQFLCMIAPQSQQLMMNHIAAACSFAYEMLKFIYVSPAGAYYRRLPRCQQRMCDARYKIDTLNVERSS